MSSKINLLWVLPAFTILLAFTTFFSDSGYKDKIIIEINSDDDYDKAWQKVDSLQNQGLTRSALEVVEQIYEAAKKDNNQPQIIKSFIYKLKFANYTEEDSHQKIVNQVKEEIKNATFPSDAILNSILAQIYWQYYTYNRYRFQNRTETVNFDNEDFQTWDLPLLIKEIVKHYHLSLEQSDNLKLIPITDFNEILIYYDSEHAYLRSTLYDLLAHNALSFYINDEASVTDPVYKFELRYPMDFASPEEFIKINFDTKDSLSLKFYAAKLFQNLIEFHLNDEKKDALIDVDLFRLNFIRTNSVHPQKDSLYLKAILEMEKRFDGVPYSSLISFNKAKYFYDEGKKYNAAVSDLHKWELKTSIEICEEAIKKYPDTYGASSCNWLKSQILLKNLTFQTEYGNIPEKPFRAFISYQNANKIFIRIIPWNEYKEKSAPKEYSEKLIEYYSSQKPIEEWSIDLPDDGDYQTHSTEIKIPELSKGQYLILVGTDKNFSHKKNSVVYGKTWVSNISYVRREKADSKIEIYTLDRETGDPLNEVIVEVYKQIYKPDYRDYRYEKVTSGKTNRDGSFEFGRDKSTYENYKLVFKKGNDRFESESYYSYYYGDNNGNRTSTYFFLDRAIYRPGQTVYFKGLIIQTDGKKDHKISSDYTTTVTFFDANHQVISDVTLTTNEYGTFNGSFVIPFGKIGGQYYLSNGMNAQYLRVEEYKRPKFEVKFDPVKGSYSLNDKVTATGFAKTYSGANLNDVEVKYRVVRRATFPYFYYWCVRFYGWYNQTQMEITNGVTKTDKDGKFKIEFDLVPDLSILKESNPVFNYTVYADVVDVTGETHSSQTYVSAGYIGLLSNINLPEIINRDSSENYFVSTTNLNGEFERANVSVTVHKLKTPERIFRKRLWQLPDKFLLSKEEFYDSFQHDIYKDENEFYNWQKGEKVFETGLTTTDSSFIKFNNLKNWEPGKYFLTLKTIDKNGTPVVFEKYFTLFDSQSDQTPLNEASWIYMNEISYEPGETAKLYVGSAEENVKALFELEQDGKIIKKEWITLDNEQKEIKIPIKEDYRGNIAAHFTLTVNNENHTHTKVISIPWTNKQLNISFETFRNKILPGSKEEWKLKIRDFEGKFASAEFLASMYDASLDAFAPNYWNFNVYPYYYSRLNWVTDNTFYPVYFQSYQYDWNTYVYLQPIYYPYFNNFGFNFYGFGYGDYRYGRMQSGVVMNEAGYDAKKETDGLTSSRLPTKGVSEELSLNDQTIVNEQKELQFEDVPLRKNLNETAFFFPELKTDENGEVVISFKVPEALTQWKFMGLAHTKDLKSGIVFNETVTQKDLMVQPNPPRFLREGDEIFFTAKVSNLSDHSLFGSATLQLFNAITMEPVDHLFENSENVKSFTADKGNSEGLSWRLKVPYGKVEAVVYRVVAKSGNFSDGEENSLPVFLNRMLVTETLPLPVKGMQTKTFILQKLMNNNSSTLQNYNLTLEFTANPAWYAIQALPYMMEYPYECTEQIFNRFYANSIATHIANSNPKIKKVFEDWKNIDTAALLSNLEKNQELKYALLEETPWVLDAQDESERKKRVGLLFDLIRMADELSRAEQKLREKQYSNGGWPWFPGLPENRFITQYIVVGFGHLERLGIKDIRENNSTWEMLKKAVLYTDIRMYEDYEYLKKIGANLSKKHIGYIQAQYLYGRSYYLDIPVDEKHKEAFNYWKGQAQKYWLSNNKYMQGMIALALYRLYDAKTAKDIVKSIIENAVFNDEMGMYFKEEWGWYWYQVPIETQALLIEAIDEITKDQDAVDLMKIWLLKQKQVQDWKTTKATAEACYALLLRGTNWLAETKMPEIKIGSEILNLVDNPEIHIESGTGYFKTSWKGDDIKPAMGSVTVTNNNQVVSWGSLYWQYYEQLDKITPHETPLKIKKQLFLKINSDTGEKIIPVDDKTKLTPGDIVQVRIEIRVDRDMEFVHLKDMRASGFEPINVLSTHKYQDGLWYYENTRDAATNFFMDWLPKGTYVFEYPLRVIHKGDFSNGITTMQCMYAPEFASHSEGVRVKVE